VNVEANTIGTRTCLILKEVRNPYNSWSDYMHKHVHAQTFMFNC